MDTIFESLRHRLPVISLIAEFLFWLITLIDETHLLILILFASLAEKVREAVSRSCEHESTARFLTLTFGLGYAAHLWPDLDLRADVIGVFLAVLRSVIAATIVHQVISIPVVTLAVFVGRYFQSGWLNLVQRSETLKSENETSRQAIKDRRRPVEQPRRREEMLRQQIDQCRIDYEYECDILRGAGLEQDELDVALESAKQKYLQRIHHVLQ